MKYLISLSILLLSMTAFFMLIPSQTASGQVVSDRCGLENRLTEINGVVVFEAEAYSALDLIDGLPNWEETRVYGDQVVGNAMQAGQGGTITIKDPGAASAMHYDIDFQTVGTYTLAIRGYADGDPAFFNDSINFGLNGTPLSLDLPFGYGGFENSGFTWRDGRDEDIAVQIPIDSPGTHRLSIWMREDGVVLDRLMLVLDSLPVPVENDSDAFGPLATTCPEPENSCGVGDIFVQTEGNPIVMEAEHFTRSSGPIDGQTWVTLDAFADLAGNRLSIGSLPDIGVNTGLETTGPFVEYDILFATPGDYVVFVRGMALLDPLTGFGRNDSIHVGLDGVPVTTDRGLGLTHFDPQNFNWQNRANDQQPTIVTVDAPGLHTLTVWMREDGLLVDRLYMALGDDVSLINDSTVLGPAESECEIHPLETPTPSQTPNGSETPALSPTPTAILSGTLTPVVTSTSTPTPVIPTDTPDVPTSTATPTPLPPTLTPTLVLPTNTNTPTPTELPITATFTPTPAEPTATNTPTSLPLPTNTNTPLPTSTNTPTSAPLPTNTNTPQPTPTHTATVIPSPTHTNTPTATPTSTSTNTPIPTPVPQDGSITILLDNNPKDGTDFPFTTNFEAGGAGRTGIAYADQVTGFDNPRGMAIDSSGSIYVVDSFNDRVVKLSSQGSIEQTFVGTTAGVGPLDQPFDVTLDSFGNLYVTDFGNNRVVKFGPSGDQLLQFGSFGTGEGEFTAVKGIAVDGAGNIYASDSNTNAIQKFDASGIFIDQLLNPGSEAGQFLEPQDIELDSSGRLLVIDSLNSKLLRFDTSFNFIDQWDTAFSNPRGLHIASSGEIYISGFTSDTIQKYTPSGSLLWVYARSGTADGSFNRPKGMVEDSSGRLFVADQFNERIQRFDPALVLDDSGSDDDGDIFGVSFLFDGLEPGAYQITQDTAPGWLLSEIDCSGEGSTFVFPDTEVVEIGLVSGDQVTCRFINSR